MQQEIFTLEQAKLATSWEELMGEYEVEKRCAKIATWLKRHCGVSGSAFFLQDSRLGRKFLYTDAVPEDVLQNLQGLLPHLHQAVDTEYEAVYLAMRDGNLSIIDAQGHNPSLKQVILATILSTKRYPIGITALVTEASSVQYLLDEEHRSCWFSPLISNLLDNAISHEEKSKKISMLNLYQTVSSSLAYVGDLHELLNTIMSIVTSELLCEEGSVLMFDEENNEFEFFTAVGETGKDLEKVRFPADKGIAGRALRERTPLVINDVASSPDFYGAIDEEHDFKTKSILAIPLISGEELVGVIEAINKIGNDGFDKEDAQILSAIADEVALAVKHARLFDYVVDSYCKIRQGLSSCKGCMRPLKSWTPCVRYLSQQV
ncbi:MAG: GAF domain-containing protein [Deltaproteobacteria bacterium]|nr:MAG: GAF domain-containing protein [Deltaproteobacteria bacterium]